MKTDFSCEVAPVGVEGRPAPEGKLERTVFVTSRALDFASQKELVAQTGHSPEAWPLVCLKELLDNSLDGCEQAGIAPIVAVTVDERGITITDNGPGIAASTIQAITDFTVRVSSKEAYIAPDRGRQGNAFKTLIAIPFVLHGDCGKMLISTRGSIYEIAMRLDRVRSAPVIAINAAPDEGENVKKGTSVTVEWPDSASSILEAAKADFYKLATDAAFLNPHLSITVDWFGHKSATPTGEVGWLKWKPQDPTSPHWYEGQHLARLIGAYVSYDAETGGHRTLREFLSEFRGLAGTGKQKAVAGACGLSGAALADLVVDGHQLDMAKVERLLLAMQNQTKPVKPQALGVLGRNHLARQFEDAGCEMDSFEYRKMENTVKGLPWVLEAAFAVHRSAFDADPMNRRLIAGVNWSPAIQNPFRQLQPYYSLDALLEQQRAGREEPVVIALHLACPRLEFMDRGKSAISLLPPMANAIIEAVTGVTTSVVCHN